jgi:ribosomal-protein-alanine N-acetyltransferase
MTILTTERLRLEPCNESHIEQLDILNSDIEVMRYITGVAITLEETKAHIELVKELWKNYGYSSWTIIELKTGKLIGTGGIQHIEFNPENPIETGWRLLPSKWGQGFATEAAQCMMKFAFENLGLENLRATCHQDNISSVKVMRRLGMQYIGIERWYNLDLFAYCMTKEQYLLNKAAMLAEA